MQREISMNHTGDWDEQRERLSAYLDDELGKGERAELERHLPTCEQCQRTLDELREVRALLRAMPMPASPRSFAIPMTGEVPRPLAAAAHDREESGERGLRVSGGGGRWSGALQAVGGLVAAAGVMLVLGSALMGQGPRFSSASTAASGAAKAPQTEQHDSTSTAYGANQATPASTLQVKTVATPTAVDQNTGAPTPTAVTNAGGGGAGHVSASPSARTATGNTYGLPGDSENLPVVPIGAGMVAGGAVLFMAGRVTGGRRKRGRA